MRDRRIRTDWASLSLAHNGAAIVCVKAKDGPRCMQFGSLEELKRAIDGKKISARKWALAAPVSLCILKPLALPVSEMAEAAKMVEFELSSLIPLPLEKVVYGCTLLDKQQNMLNVLVCIVTLSTLDQILEPCRAVGIQPSKIIVDSLAAQSWFNTVNNAGSGPWINVFVDKGHGIILTGIDGNFQKSNHLNFCNGDIAICSHEIAREALHECEELPASIRKNTCITLAGAKEYISATKSLLDDYSGDSAFSKVHIAETPKITPCGNGESERDCADLIYDAVIAAGLFESFANPGLQYLNLLPGQYMEKSQQRALVFNYVITGALSLMSILLLWLCLVAMSWRVEGQSRRIEAQIKPIEQVAGSVDKKRQRVKVIQQQLSNRGQITQIFEELYKHTPANISISELKFSRRAEVTNIDIKGQADLLSAAFEYSDAMSKAKLLDKIQIINAQQIPRPGGSIVEFTAGCAVPSE